MRLCLIFGKFGKKVLGRVINPLWCLKAPSPATKKWVFEFYTNLDLETTFKPFGLDGWLKVSYLLDYIILYLEITLHQIS